MLQKIFVVLGLAAAAMSTGCTGTIISDTSGKTSTISPKSSWHAYGDLRDNPNAVDGNPDTAAITGNSYENATLTVDLGKPCVFNMIILDHGARYDFNFCRRVTVAISYDGRNFTQIYAAPGTRRITYVCLLTPTLARYIRFQAIVPGDRPWAVGEIYIQ